MDQGGKSTYTSRLPAIAVALMNTASTGLEPPANQVAAAKASLGPSTIRYIVITNATAHPDLVASAASDITGCSVRRVSDVLLCELPQS